MKNLLFLCSRFPYPLEKGDKLRAYHQIKGLSNNFNVHLVCIVKEDPNQQDLEELKPFTKSINTFKIGTQFYFNIIKNLLLGRPFQLSFFESKEAKEHISCLIKKKQIDLCFTQLVRMAPYSIDLDIPKVLDYMDVLSLGVQRQSKHQRFLKKWLYQIESKRLAKYEEKLSKKYNKHFIISEQDKDLLPFASPDIIVLKNGVNDIFIEEKQHKNEYDICFVGNMSYPPNVIAAKQLIKEILPLVEKEIPNVKVLLAGASPSKDVLKLEKENVRVSGWMDDIREAYLSSKIFVAPLQIGTGLQNKLLEAMALKTPCITTTLCNNALKAVMNEEIIIANSSEEFASNIIGLLNNSDRYNSIAQKGHDFVCENYQWEGLNQKLLAELNQL